MLTSSGFQRKRYADIVEDMKNMAKTLFGEDVNLSERSPLGKFIQLVAYQRAEDYELAEDVYYSAFVDFAEGATLDYAVKRVGITRKPWLKATGPVILNIEKGTTVPAGTIVGKPTNVKYKTLETVTAVETGDYTVKVEALEFGEIGNAEVGEINTIYTPVFGLNSVTNTEAFRNGQDEETDEELRERYYASLSKGGSSRIESMRAKILDEVEVVRACLIIENDSDVPDADGRPPHSFETIVLGGEASAIAQKIFQTKPAGIRAYGSQTEIVYDSQGKDHIIGFSYAQHVPIYVKVQVKKGTDYPLNGDDLVKEEIVKYIGGEANGTVYNGLGMSESVILAKVLASVLKVSGVIDAAVQLSTDGVTYGENNILIDFAQVADTDFTKIEVSKLV